MSSQPKASMAFNITPFDQPNNADLILLSSDDEKFYVRKALLILASAVFESMFTLPQGAQQDGEVFPVVKVQDGKAVVYQLLLWCDPRCKPSWNVTNIQLALSAADKYDMQGVMARIEQVLTSASQFVEAVPIEMYAIGVRYGFKGLARNAAKEVLCVKLESILDILELASISGVAIQRLCRYKDQCRSAAERVARDVSWLMDRDFVWCRLMVYHCPFDTWNTISWSCLVDRVYAARWGRVIQKTAWIDNSNRRRFCEGADFKGEYV